MKKTQPEMETEEKEEPQTPPVKKLVVDGYGYESPFKEKDPKTKPSPLSK